MGEKRHGSGHVIPMLNTARTSGEVVCCGAVYFSPKN